MIDIIKTNFNVRIFIYVSIVLLFQSLYLIKGYNQGTYEIVQGDTAVFHQSVHNFVTQFSYSMPLYTGFGGQVSNTINKAKGLYPLWPALLDHASFTPPIIYFPFYKVFQFPLTIYFTSIFFIILFSIFFIIKICKFYKLTFLEIETVILFYLSMPIVIKDLGLNHNYFSLLELPFFLMFFYFYLKVSFENLKNKSTYLLNNLLFYLSYLLFLGIKEDAMLFLFVFFVIAAFLNKQFRIRNILLSIISLLLFLFYLFMFVPFLLNKYTTIISLNETEAVLKYAVQSLIHFDLNRIFIMIKNLIKFFGYTLTIFPIVIFILIKFKHKIENKDYNLILSIIFASFVQFAVALSQDMRPALLSIIPAILVLLLVYVFKFLKVEFPNYFVFLNKIKNVMMVLFFIFLIKISYSNIFPFDFKKRPLITSIENSFKRIPKNETFTVDNSNNRYLFYYSFSDKLFHQTCAEKFKLLDNIIVFKGKIDTLNLKIVNQDFIDEYYIKIFEDKYLIHYAKKDNSWI